MIRLAGSLVAASAVALLIAVVARSLVGLYLAIGTSLAALTALTALGVGRRRHR